jgi:hypothetical protein
MRVISFRRLCCKLRCKKVCATLLRSVKCLIKRFDLKHSSDKLKMRMRVNKHNALNKLHVLRLCRVSIDLLEVMTLVSCTLQSVKSVIVLKTDMITFVMIMSADLL